MSSNSFCFAAVAEVEVLLAFEVAVLLALNQDLGPHDCFKDDQGSRWENHAVSMMGDSGAEW